MSGGIITAPEFGIVLVIMLPAELVKVVRTPAPPPTTPVPVPKPVALEVSEPVIELEPVAIEPDAPEPDAPDPKVVV